MLSNGRIKRFDILIQDQKENVKNGSSQWESITVHGSEAVSRSTERKIVALKQIQLANNKAVKVFVTAFNSVGKSPEASLVIPETLYGR